jgi:hypothetical protein
VENSVPAALAVLAVTVLCLGYLLPHVSRRRAIDAELPVEDRFSASARVIEPPTVPASAGRSSTALLTGTRVQRTEIMQRPATSRPISPARPVRPTTAVAAPKTAPKAAPKAAPRTASETARRDGPGLPSAVPLRLAQARARAARLRTSLLIAFCLLTACALVLWATAELTHWAVVVCAALASSVLVAGRLAVVAEHKSDAVRSLSSPPEAVRPAPVAEPAATPQAAPPTSPAVRQARRPSQVSRGRADKAVKLPQPLEIKAMSAEELAADEPAARGARRFATARPRLVADDAEAAPLSAPEVSPAAPDQRPPAREEGEAWTPPEIPAPSYTLVSGAPRWEPKPLTASDFAQARRAAALATQRAADEARAEGVETAATREIPIPGRVIFSDGALDLERAIAARRRAAAAR